MSRQGEKVRRLFNKTRVFIARKRVRTVLDYVRNKLDSFGKSSDLGARVRAIEELQEVARNGTDVGAKEKLIDALQNDEEAKLMILQKALRHIWQGKSLGYWLTPGAAEVIMQYGREAERESKLERNSELEGGTRWGG